VGIHTSIMKIDLLAAALCLLSILVNPKQLWGHYSARNLFLLWRDRALEQFGLVFFSLALFFSEAFS